MERPTNLADAHLECAVADVHVSPGELEQLILRDELPGPPDQMLENGKRLRREGNDLVTPAQLSSRGIEPERTERIGRHGGFNEHILHVSLGSAE